METKEFAEAVENTKQALEHLADSLRNAVAAAAESVGFSFDRINRILAQAVEWKAANAWAEKYRPKYLRIYNRTKKHRTRKKYYNKILREYRKERDHAQSN